VIQPFQQQLVTRYTAHLSVELLQPGKKLQKDTWSLDVMAELIKTGYANLVVQSCQFIMTRQPVPYVT
jgi:hypothetical protein